MNSHVLGILKFVVGDRSLETFRVLWQVTDGVGKFFVHHRRLQGLSLLDPRPATIWLVKPP